MSDERVWLQYPPTGGKQHFHEDAVEAWKARGWVECDPPVEPSPFKDPPPADTTPVEAPDVAPVTEESNTDSERIHSENVSPAADPEPPTPIKTTTRRAPAVPEEG